MSQVCGFAKQSGGHVQVESELQVGTTVTLYLPRNQRQPRAQSKQDVLAEPKAIASCTVLIVEDNETVRGPSVFLFKEMGCEVMEAGDAATALTVLQDNPHIMLLFADIGLGKRFSFRGIPATAAQAVCFCPANHKAARRIGMNGSVVTSSTAGQCTECVCGSKHSGRAIPENT